MSDADPPDIDEQPMSPFSRWFRKRKPTAPATRRLNGNGNGHYAEPHAMRLRISEFETSKVEDVMVPRADMKAVELDMPMDELVKYFAEVSYSRLPVYRETLDDPIGFVHIKDLVEELASADAPRPKPLSILRRDVLFVPPSMKLPDLLLKMQQTRIHLALVVDEYGGTDGLVTLEDVVEEIVGDIDDEHDDDAPMFTRRTESVWEADARTEIEDFAEETGLDLGIEEMEDEIDTIGGIAFAICGRIPVRGEVLLHPSGSEIEIVDADARRIRRVRVRMPGALPSS